MIQRDRNPARNSIPDKILRKDKEVPYSRALRRVWRTIMAVTTVKVGLA